MKRFVSLALSTLVLACAAAQTRASVPLTKHQEDARKLGDTLQYAVPAAALAMTFFLRPDDPVVRRYSFDSGELIHLDGSPRHDLALAVGRAFIINEALKYGFNETRPNGGSHSFPSGHASIAFTGAEFIRKEYGWWWGAPAYAVASYVGWSRVDAKEHYTRDVLAGAAIGIAVNHDFSELHTRFGLLSIAPTLMMLPGNRPPPRDSTADVPGVHVKLEF